MLVLSRWLLCWINYHIQQFMWKLILFHTKMISAQFLQGNVLLRWELQVDVTNSHFEHDECAFSYKSGSMPLSQVLLALTLTFDTPIRCMYWLCCENRLKSNNVEVWVSLAVKGMTAFDFTKSLVARLKNIAILVGFSFVVTPCNSQSKNWAEVRSFIFSLPG